MKDQINTIREFVESQRHVGRTKALAALTQLEAMAGEPVAWCPALTYPGHEKDRAWANGKPRNEDIEYWTLNGKGITYAYAAPVAQQRKTVTNDEQASAYMDARLWEFIDMAGMWPRAKPDPRIWAHVMVYAPVAQQPQAKPHKPLFADLIAQHPGLREELLEMDKQPQAEAVPSSALNPDESDPVTLWAEIWRLREAVKGPDGYATWQDAATAERIRRVRAESKQAEASALIERLADALRSCSGVPHWPSFQPLINEASKWKVEAVPPTHVLVPVEPTEAMMDAAVQAICYGPEGGFTRISGPQRAWKAMIDAAIAQQKGGV